MIEQVVKMIEELGAVVRGGRVRDAPARPSSPVALVRPWKSLTAVVEADAMSSMAEEVAGGCSMAQELTDASPLYTRSQS